MADDSQNAGWTIFSYLISGMLFYAGVGWLIGHFTRIALLFPPAGRTLHPPCKTQVLG